MQKETYPILMILKDMPRFDFWGLRFDNIISDYNDQQQFEIERGEPGVYLTFFNYDKTDIQKTYLCPFRNKNSNEKNRKGEIK